MQTTNRKDDDVDQYLSRIRHRHSRELVQRIQELNTAILNGSIESIYWQKYVLAWHYIQLWGKVGEIMKNDNCNIVNAVNTVRDQTMRLIIGTSLWSSSNMTTDVQLNLEAMRQWMTDTEID